MFRNFRFWIIWEVKFLNIWKMNLKKLNDKDRLDLCKKYFIGKYCFFLLVKVYVK